MSIRNISLFVVSASLTVIIELLVLYIEKVRDKRLWLSIPINIFTNFVFNLILFFIPILWVYIIVVIFGEIIIFFVESISNTIFQNFALHNQNINMIIEILKIIL